jgi:ABC-type transporter Mla subunit MlaD
MDGRATFLRVGLLIVAGAALLIGLVWFLGGNRISKGTLYESYFSESVSGLEIGVPVRYRGVAVGRVTEIGLVTAEYGSSMGTAAEQANYRLVFVRYLIDTKRFGRDLNTEDAVKLGLRARLATTGLTGVAYLELDFVDPQQYPAVKVPWTPTAEYIPSMPTTLTQVEDATKLLIARLNRIDIVQISNNLNKLLEDADTLVRTTNGELKTADLPGLVADLRQTTASLRSLVDNPEIGRILANSAAATEKLTQTIAQIPPLIVAVQAVTRRADAGVADTQQALVPLLRDIQATTANLKELTDSLRRDPARLLVGQPPPRQNGNGQ